MANEVIPFPPPNAQSPCTMPMHRSMLEIMRYAQENKTLGCITGPGGIGKSTAAKAHRASDPRVRLVEATSRTRTDRQLMAAIARALGFYSVCLEEAHFFNDLRRHFADGGLLVIDEMQFLKDSGMNLVRHVNDPVGKEGIGVVLIGNQIAISERAGKTRHLHTQLLSRLCPRLHLDQPDDDDYAEFFDHHRIMDKQARAVIRRASDAFGAFRVATRIINRAREIAGAGHSIDRALVDRAISYLGYTDENLEIGSR
jgi:DNA transposition AAA+ family ATPase